MQSWLVDTSNENNEKPKLEDTNISSLLFEGLKLNIKKTKIIIFNKQGANIKKFKFYYRDKEIEIAKQYTYLGFTFTPSGKKQVGTDNLINKARKVWFSIQKMLHKSKEKTIDVYLKLIDSLVKPIILYACEY